MDQNRYEISYRTEYGDPALAQDWALRRAAELTLENRYDWFQVVRRSRAYDDRAFDRYDPYLYNRDGNFVDQSDTAYGDRYPSYYDDDRYDDAVAVIEVVMGNAPAPRASSVYDARRFLDYARDRRVRY